MAAGKSVLGGLSSLSLYWRMTRPAFLLLTVAGCALGLALAAALGADVPTGVACATVLLACAAHAGANVLNDFHDSRSGADVDNPGALYPFTGGAQLIQRGKVSEAATGRWAWVLLAGTAAGGLALVAWQQAWPVLGIGLAGLLLAWAYSAPPLQLMMRGWGEVAVGLSWTLVVLGAALVAEPQMDATDLCTALVLGLGFGLLAANLLLINGLPDAVGDARVGKRTVAVRLGGRRVARLYAALVALAYGGVALWGVWETWSGGNAPDGATAVLGALPLSALASVLLWRHADDARALKGAIVATIAAALAYGALGAWALLGAA